MSEEQEDDYSEREPAGRFQRLALKDLAIIVLWLMVSAAILALLIFCLVLLRNPAVVLR